MQDYTYTLHPDSIAKYPASPRGSSKLLHCDEDGHVTYHANFSTAVVPLLQGKHVVFNESRVLDARLYVQQQSVAAETERDVELMILDLGRVDLSARCDTVPLNAMIRVQDAKTGDVFPETSSGTKIEIVEVIG